MSMDLGKNIAACTDAYDVLKKGDDWSNNILSQKTVRGPSGQLGLPGEVDAVPDATELALCTRLAAAAAKVAPDLEVGMGSASDDKFEAFFVAKHDGWRCDALAPAALRPLFGGALFADATIDVSPLKERGRWWERVVAYYTEADEDEPVELPNETREGLKRYRKILSWFHAQKDFVEVAFVSVDKRDPFSLRGGCVLPRLILGRTRGESVAGLFGIVVDR
ncbi:MAG TPA: hypothetical protein VN903_12610 [Polyangia bacterium]|nr:hypothetical protein [Polyangia bacterium]